MKQRLAAAVFIVLCGVWAFLSAQHTENSGRALCAFDGLEILPLYRVEVRLPDKSLSMFCGIACAKQWLQDSGAKSAVVTVADEATGKQIPADKAFFVKSKVITNRSTGNNLHSFEKREDAEKHAREYRGDLVPNPLGEGNQ